MIANLLIEMAIIAAILIVAMIIEYLIDKHKNKQEYAMVITAEDVITVYIVLLFVGFPWLGGCILDKIYKDDAIINK